MRDEADAMGGTLPDRPEAPINPATWGRALEHLTRLASVADGIAADEGRPTYHFVFSLFSPDPLWLANLHAFPVPTFRGDEPLVGGEREGNPIVIAVNSTIGLEELALAVAGYIVGTLRRQAALDDLMSEQVSLSAHVEGVPNLDRVSRSESIAVARALLAGRRDEVRLAASRWGFGISARAQTAFVLDRRAFSARIPFLARCYNEISVVRDAVDRIVSATVGVGPRITSRSEEVRRIAEQATSAVQTHRYFAHALRDAVLLGAGAVVMEVEDAEPQLRLIRPDHLELVANDSRTDVYEHIDGQRTLIPNATVLPGTAQPGSSYPCSLLEPYVLTLYNAVQVGGTAKTIEARLPAAESRSPEAAHLAATVETAKRIAETADGSLKGLLGPVFSILPPPRYPLYLRGRENWR